MFTEDMVKTIIEGAARFNLAVYPWSVVIPAVLALAAIWLTVRAFRKPGVVSSRILKIFIGTVYQYAGLSVAFVCLGRMDSALFGTFALCSVGMLFYIDAAFKKDVLKLTEKPVLRFVSIFLMAYGIFLYPVVEKLTGFGWPGMVFFGAECPTTIFTIGLLLAVMPKANRLILILLSLNAMMTGFSVGLSGGYFDYAYGLAGAISTVFIILYRKEFFARRSG